MLRKIEHVAIAVGDLEAAIELYSTVWGLRLEGREVVKEQGVEEATFRIGESKIQLLHPLSPDSVVGKFLAKRGEGLHHIAYEVHDIDEAVQALESGGMKIARRSAETGADGRKIAFIHPQSNHGVLIELIQKAGLSRSPAQYD